MSSPKQAPVKETPVEDLYNISEVTGGWLRDLGISTYGELCESDLIEVWSSLRKRYAQVTKLMYYALVGATLNVHWAHIPDDLKKKIDEHASLGTGTS